MHIFYCASGKFGEVTGVFFDASSALFDSGTGET